MHSARCEILPATSTGVEVAQAASAGSQRWAQSRQVRLRVAFVDLVARLRAGAAFEKVMVREVATLTSDAWKEALTQVRERLAIVACEAANLVALRKLEAAGGLREAANSSREPVEKRCMTQAVHPKRSQRHAVHRGRRVFEISTLAEEAGNAVHL